MPRPKSRTKKSAKTKPAAKTKKRATTAKLKGSTAVRSRTTTRARTTLKRKTRVTPIPKGYERVTPHLVVENATDAITFYKKAFDAKEISRAPSPDGKKLMHAEIKIGNSVIFLCDDFPEYSGTQRNPKALGGSSVTIHNYVKNVDKAVEQAVKAGATVKMPPMDAFWGDRYGVITDPYGHEWSFATHIKDVTPAEMAKAAEEMFKKG